MSAAKHKFDLTHGGILDKLLLVALPIMGTQLMQMLYNLTDMFWLGRVGSGVVASAGTAGMYLWLSNGLMFIGRTGAEIGVSQYLGKGNKDTARQYSQNSLFLAVTLGVFFSVVTVIFSRQLIGFFGIREVEVAADAVSYLMITALGVPAAFITGAVAGSFNASGNSRIPFFSNAAGLIINIILDPFLIFGLKMGITGAAIATILAQWMVCAFSLITIKWKRTRPLGEYSFRFKPDGEKLSQIFKWSIPVCLESMLFTFLSMINSRFITAFGADAIAINRVGSQIESLSWLIAGGFSSALTAFVGQNFGAGKWGRIHSGVKLSIISMSLWGTAVTIILYFAGGALFQFILPDPKLAVMGAEFLQILSLCQIIAMLEGVGSGGFRGIGKTLPPSISSVTTNTFRVGLAYVLSRTALGLNGIWWGITIGACIRGLWTFLWFMFDLRRQPTEDLPVS